MAQFEVVYIKVKWKKFFEKEPLNLRLSQNSCASFKINVFISLGALKPLIQIRLSLKN